MNREGIAVAGCTVERLMRAMGLQGARRGKTVRTTTPDTSAPCPLNHVNRHFHASCPNELWVPDFTYVCTWQGWLYVAFVVDVYARRIVGWRVSGTGRPARCCARSTAGATGLQARKGMMAAGISHAII
jgi:transposase InsO family protein